MALLDDLPPEEHRRRYESLLAAARSRARQAAPKVPPPLDEASVVERETIPGGWYWSARLRRGATLRLVNIAATPGVALLLWNADDPSERYNASDTVKVQWTARLTAGHVLLSDMGRVLASITADDCGWHDTLLGGSTEASNLRRYGRPHLRNSRDNFLRAAGKLGLGPRDIPPSMSFFSAVQTDAEGRFRWRDGAIAAGAAVDLRAEMNVLAVVSNCPHPLAPGDYAPQPIEAIVWRSPPPAADDACRRFGPEAERAFANTAKAMMP